MTEESAQTLERHFRQTLVPAFRAAGFVGSRRNFRKIRPGWAIALNIQGGALGRVFAINIGIHPLGLPDTMEQMVDPKKIMHWQCQFSSRLGPGCSDFWFSHRSSEATISSAVARATAMFADVGEPFIRRWAGENSPLLTVSPDEFSRDELDFEGLADTKIHRALLLARLRFLHDDFEAAAEFARQGLNLPSAIFNYRVARNLEQVLERAIAQLNSGV